MKAPGESGSRTIAFCGTRGLPAKYGGFETTVDEISKRFVRQGYDCVVFCRLSSRDQTLDRHEGRKLVYVKGSTARTLDTFVSAFQTGWHLFRYRRRYDYVFWFNNANLPGIILTLLARIPLSVNTDGLEWRRTKWRWPFKAYAFLSSFLIARLCKSLISDSRTIQSYYRETFFKDSEFIPYGLPYTVKVAPDRESAILERYRLAAGRYFLQITRFEPENLPLDVARAFSASGLAEKGFKLLLLGYQHESAYSRSIKAMSGRDGIVVADSTYDSEVLAALRRNCFCYVHGNSVGGTNHALLEAMASCPRVLAVDVPFSREVLAETGYYFSPHDLTVSLRNVLEYPDQSAAMQDRARSFYDWDLVTESYINLVEGRPAAYPSISEKG